MKLKPVIAKSRSTILVYGIYIVSLIYIKVSWIKETTPTNTPLQISTNEDILQNYQVEGHNKYDVIRTVNNNREQYQLVIRALTENDAGNYNCQIRLTNLNYKQWPRKTASLTVQSKFMHYFLL